MPRKVPLSGAAGAKLARENKIRRLLDQLRELGWTEPVTPPAPAANADGRPVPDWVREFEEAGEPDLDNSEVDLSYQRKLLQIVSRQAARTYDPPALQQQHWKRIRDNAAVVGLTHPRAKLETDLRAVQADLAKVKAATTGALRVENGTAVARPGTARGSRGARGPRPLPGRGARPAPPENPGDAPVGGGDVG